MEHRRGRAIRRPLARAMRHSAARIETSPDGSREPVGAAADTAP